MRLRNIFLGLCAALALTGSALQVSAEESNFSGLRNEGDSWVYYENGEKCTEKTGLVLYENQWFYVEAGVMNTEKAGFVEYNGENFYVAAGRVVSEQNGIVRDGGDWYFVADGRFVKEFTGLTEYDGYWFVLKNGILNTEYNDLYDYNGGTFLVAAGQIKKDYSGLFQAKDKAWYFISGGQVSTDCTSLVLYDNQWFYVRNGVLAEDYTGWVNYDGGRFYIVNGMLCEATEDSGSGSEQAPEQKPEETPDVTPEYTLNKIQCVVNGVMNVNEENGLAAFEAQWKEAVGVDLEILQLDHSTYADGVMMLLAAGEVPDVMLLTPEMYNAFAKEGFLWDMTEAYNNSDFKYRLLSQSAMEGLKRDGRLYGVAPTFGNGCVTYVKKSWLDAVGLHEKDIRTYDDYIRMLTLFATGDPDGNGIEGDTYGVISAGFMGAEAPYVNYLPEFWQDAYPGILKDTNGVWYDGFRTAETKAALLRLQQAYNEGLIDPDSLFAGTKYAREKWWSNDQTGSAGVFTYWAGSWAETLVNNLIKNEVDSEIVQLNAIEEVGGYYDRSSYVWVIPDDGDGDGRREQAIFDAFIETMLDGDRVQTLWTYGAEDVHWSTKAETFTTYAGTYREKVYSYADGEFHLKQSPSDCDSLWKKNLLDAMLTLTPLTNGYVNYSDRVMESLKGFLSDCKSVPEAPSASYAYINSTGNVYDAKMRVITDVVVNGMDIDKAMAEYDRAVGAVVAEALAELNAY